MKVDLNHCRRIDLKEDPEDYDPDGCSECEWEPWRCHDAAIEKLIHICGIYGTDYALNEL